jgi:hypothetical protein
MNRKGCGRKPSGHALYIDLHRRLKSSQFHVLLALSPDKTLTISKQTEDRTGNEAGVDADIILCNVNPVHTVTNYGLIHFFTMLHGTHFGRGGHVSVKRPEDLKTALSKSSLGTIRILIQSNQQSQHCLD